MSHEVVVCIIAHLTLYKGHHDFPVTSWGPACKNTSVGFWRPMQLWEDKLLVRPPSRPEGAQLCSPAKISSGLTSSDWPQNKTNPQLIHGSHQAPLWNKKIYTNYCLTLLQTNGVLITTISKIVLSFSAFFLPPPLLCEAFRVKLLKAVLWQNALPALLQTTAFGTCFFLLVLHQNWHIMSICYSCRDRSTK